MTDTAWADTVAAQADGPYFFAAEAVLPFVVEADVRQVVGPLAERFPVPCRPWTPPAPASSPRRTSTTR